MPSEGSEAAGRRALALAAAMAPDETLVVLLSGGASALMAVPAEGVTLDDKRQTTDRLLRAGADIHALNAVRKHLSAIKGGWLAVRAAGPCRTFAISDVVGDDMSVIASGPTVADEATYADALAVLERFGGAAAYPAAVVARLTAGAAGRVPETPKPGDPALARARSAVIGGRRDAMHGAAADATARGYEAVVIDDPIVGDARLAGAACVQRAGAAGRRAAGPSASCRAAKRRFTSPGVAAAAATRSSRSPRRRRSPGSAAWPRRPASAPTASTARPTPRARSWTRRPSTGPGWRASRRPTTSTTTTPIAFFDALGDLVHTGPTGTNVGDLQIILLA